MAGFGILEDLQLSGRFGRSGLLVRNLLRKVDRFPGGGLLFRTRLRIVEVVHFGHGDGAPSDRALRYSTVPQATQAPSGGISRCPGATDSRFGVMSASTFLSA